MQDYRVELDAYNGPLDLMLYLVRRHEIDLNDIPVATLTDQYLAHLKQMQRIDMDLAGEFLVMAATLLEIKSLMLLPRQEQPASDPSQGLSELDPRYELVQQLLAYKRFKDAAGELEQRKAQWERRLPRLPAKLKSWVNADMEANAQDEDDAEPVEFDLEDVDVMDLFAAFQRMLDAIGQARDPALHQVMDDDTPIALHAADIVDRLERLEAGKTLTMREIFTGRKSRGEMIGLFLALLELVQRKRVKVNQDDEKAEIHLSLTPAEEQTVDQNATPFWRNPQTGEVDFEWSTEAQRLRAEHRARLRAQRAAVFGNKSAQPAPEEGSGKPEVTGDSGTPGTPEEEGSGVWEDRDAEEPFDPDTDASSREDH